MQFLRVIRSPDMANALLSDDHRGSRSGGVVEKAHPAVQTGD